MRYRPLAASLAALLLLNDRAVSQAPGVPQGSLASSLNFTGYVVDQANLLPAGQRRELVAKLGRFQRETKHQIAIVTVSTLGGNDAAAFTRVLANRWGVGRRGWDDGVVLLIAPSERKARIEVGRGLERRLTNSFCQAVLRTKMVPAFRIGHFYSGIDAGVSAITSRLKATKG